MSELIIHELEAQVKMLAATIEHRDARIRTLESEARLAKVRIQELSDAGRKIMEIHDALSVRLERGEQVGDAFEIWDSAMDDMESALDRSRE